MKKIVLSSSNKHKVNEIKMILENMPFIVVSKDEEGYGNFDVEEDKDTLEGNAIKKAKELQNLTKEIVIADDTGLFVDALNGEPGVYSARYAGEPLSDERNNALLLKNLEGVPIEKRTAYFKTIIAVALEDGSTMIAEGICRGKIGFEKKGIHGFGYDPLFIVDEKDQTFGEMEDVEKNKISHRSRALLNLKKELEELIENNSNQW